MKPFDGREDPTWETQTLSSPYTAPVTPVAAILDDSGDVTLQGLVVRNGASSGATLCTLAEEFWPTFLVYRDVITEPLSSSSGYLRITTAGVVTLHQRSGTVTDFILSSAAPYTVL